MDKPTICAPKLPPITDEKATYLSEQLEELYSVVVYMTQSHEAEKTAKPAPRRGHLRIYDPEQPIMPALEEGKIRISDRDLAPALRDELRSAFEHCDDLLMARMTQDQTMGWRTQAQMKGDLEKIRHTIVKGALPECAAQLVEVAQKMAFSTRKLRWRKAVEEHYQQLASGQRPSHPGA